MQDLGKRRYTLIPPHALGLVVDVLTLGASKHGDHGWAARSPEYYVDKVFRHLEAWRAGEATDPETGLSHVAHVAADALLLLAIVLGKDTRKDG